MISDLDIFRSAKLWLDRHGDAAIVEARCRVAELQSTGDRDGADVWLRIVIAIETLLTPMAGTH
ncbi:hypothetical protein GCM10011611_02480 [Aliidongia dinghuensis]|uniref:Uncharacterized protein n=1 Tax=Aliidongia dinghuensis TaxID=1867774 RepID=A0A8J2YNQ2_9PROT|nr:hypothetical protein [Aliidongia dinghuensis]GGF00382.1 hypothetical protein GCM10011611_02480 [Aliidongia dinghuensis]